MIQNVLRDIGGIGLYGVISISLFFTVFVGTVIWAWRLKKPFVNTMSDLPLEEESTTDPASGNDPEDLHHA